MGVYYEVGMRLYDMLWRCLAPHLGERLPSGHFASICGTIIGGVHPDTGQRFTIIEPEVGGWGGSPRRTATTPCSPPSTARPTTVPRKWLRPATASMSTASRSAMSRAARGKFRGGKGVVLEYRVRSDSCFLTAAYSRNKHLPWSAHGGREGSANRIEVIRADGRTEHHAVVGGTATQP